ncbi:uncharacterized protein [Branchiostoma lanceolatum]|uniref:uncharacterized protein n=1 Tax=Branchiostoma lanceolatum TaxID=7740 RepID=UPI003454B3B7
MARPGDDDYVWSDFDFSDFEEDLETLQSEEYIVEDDLSDGDDQSDAVTNAAASKLYVCEVCGKKYKIARWFDKHKSKEHPETITAEAPQPGTSNTSDEQGASNNTSAKGPRKATQSRRKLKVKRPTSKFEEKDALQEGPQLLTDALQEATNNPAWKVTFGSMETPGNRARRTATEILDIWPNVDSKNFILTLFTLLCSVITAGDTSVLFTAGNEVMWAAYHKLCSGEVFHSLWNNLMSKLKKDPCPSLYIFITKKVFEGLLKMKHNVDAPPSSGNCNSDDIRNMSEAEEQVLRYVAGYIPHALLKRYKKCNNKIAKLYVSVLEQWKVSGTRHSDTSFLKYTEGWVNAVDRGGLFNVTDKVYLFFRAMEKIVRSTANIQQLNQGIATGIKHETIRKLETDFLVNKYWCVIACDITDEKASVALMEKVLSYYVNLRCKAFADAYMLVHNAAASKKGEKSLRKSLNSQDS